MTNAVDNPVWKSLTGLHSRLAQGSQYLKWFPRDVAPFIAVPEADTRIDDASLAASDLQAAYFVGVVPDTLPDAWRVESRSCVLQMLYTGESVAPAHWQFVEMTAAHRSAMFELASVAFPDFFRARTAELGTYFGVFAAKQLVAMAGERMGFGNLREISGVCTLQIMQGTAMPHACLRCCLDGIGFEG